MPGIGEHNFAGQYQQMPSPQGGGLVKAAWFRSYAPNERPDQFDRIVQSWDTANKASELSDSSVFTTWGSRARTFIFYLRASCRNAEMAWFLHAGASSGGEREGLAVEEADESVSGQGGHAEHQMT